MDDILNSMKQTRINNCLTANDDLKSAETSLITGRLGLRPTLGRYLRSFGVTVGCTSTSSEDGIMSRLINYLVFVKSMLIIQTQNRKRCMDDGKANAHV
jgi:hypothetical protein